MKNKYVVSLDDTYVKHFEDTGNKRMIFPMSIQGISVDVPTGILLTPYEEQPETQKEISYEEAERIYKSKKHGKCAFCSKTPGTIGCADYVSNCSVYSCEEGMLEYERKKAYVEGLNYAWELARKIVLHSTERGYTCDELRDMFDTENTVSIFFRHGITEAMARVHTYEEINVIKEGDIIVDPRSDGEHLLVCQITDEYYECMSGESFEPVYIGKDFIKYYKSLNDRKDINKIAEHFNKVNASGDKDG